VYDVDLTLTLPRHLTYTSGINAIAHCVEALYSSQSNPLIESVAVMGIAKLRQALLTLREMPEDMAARGLATTGAWAAGICLGHVGMAIHHKLCHTLGGSFGLPHSETHTVLLPHAMAYNAEAAPDAMSTVRRLFDSQTSAARAIWDMEKELGTVTSLKELGMREQDLEKAADLALQARYPNPAPLERSKLLALLVDAYHGNPPK
jgi:maleylacetate reductase